MKTFQFSCDGFKNAKSQTLVTAARDFALRKAIEKYGINGQVLDLMEGDAVLYDAAFVATIAQHPSEGSETMRVPVCIKYCRDVTNRIKIASPSEITAEVLANVRKSFGLNQHDMGIAAGYSSGQTTGKHERGESFMTASVRQRYFDAFIRMNEEIDVKEAVK